MIILKSLTHKTLIVGMGFSLDEESSPSTGITIDFTFRNWSKSYYILMPDSAYNGKPFE